MRDFIFYQGNNQYKLAEELNKQLSEAPLSPMTKEVIVVQTAGLKQWLQHYFAKQNKISG